MGNLPNGQYAEQYVSAKHLSREELCAPLDKDTLQQVEACSNVDKHQVSCRVVRENIGFKGGTVSFAITIFFEGELPNGQHVKIDIKDKLLIATLLLEKHTWYLTQIHTIKVP